EALLDALRGESELEVRVAPGAVPDGIDDHRQVPVIRQREGFLPLDLLGAAQAVEEENGAALCRRGGRSAADQERRGLSERGEELLVCWHVEAHAGGRYRGSVKTRSGARTPLSACWPRSTAPSGLADATKVSLMVSGVRSGLHSASSRQASLTADEITVKSRR